MVVFIRGSGLSISKTAISKHNLLYVFHRIHTQNMLCWCQRRMGRVVRENGEIEVVKITRCYTKVCLTPSLNTQNDDARATQYDASPFLLYGLTIHHESAIDRFATITWYSIMSHVISFRFSLLPIFHSHSHLCVTDNNTFTIQLPLHHYSICIHPRLSL